VRGRTVGGWPTTDEWERLHRPTPTVARHDVKRDGEEAEGVLTASMIRVVKERKEQSESTPMLVRSRWPALGDLTAMDRKKKGLKSAAERKMAGLMTDAGHD